MNPEMSSVDSVKNFNSRDQVAVKVSESQTEMTTAAVDVSSACREEDATSSDESKKLCDAFGGSQLSFIEECTEDLEMEYEFTESRDSLTDLPSSHTYRKEHPLKDGFLFVLSDDYEWFRLYVAVYSKHLDAYHNILDPLPGITVSISSLTRVLKQEPCQLEAQYSEQKLYPFVIINPRGQQKPLLNLKLSDKTDNRGSSTDANFGSVCISCPLRPQSTPNQLQLATQTFQEAEEWVAAIQSRISASSLDIEGLNLEGCASFVPIESAPDNQGAISQTLQLLNELLREAPVIVMDNAEASQAKLPLQNQGLGDDNPNASSGAKPKLIASWSEEEKEQHANIMAHQQALRRATHLRQRKISTELKLETIQKQLRRAKKTQPKAIPEEGNDRLAFEEQLQELTETLKTLEGNLGQTELEAQKTKRNWDSKMEEVYKHIYDPATILNIDQWAERKNTTGRNSSRRIGGGSLRVRAAKFMQSPKPKKKSQHDKDHDKHGSNLEDSDTDEKNAGSRLVNKQRRGTFRVFGSLLDSKRGRFGGSGKTSSQKEPSSLSGSQKNKAETTSSSSIDQDKEPSAEQAVGSATMALAESIMGAARDHRSHEQVTPSVSAPRESDVKPTRGEIPAWVLKEIELFEQLIRDYRSIHGNVADMFET